MNLPTIFDQGPYTKEFIGGKGFGLWEMQQGGINVPPALIIPVDTCLAYLKAPKKMMKEVKALLPEIQNFFIDQFGYMPLLSVRSGAPVSMPGMMNTILNVGLDDTTQSFWTEQLGEACAKDCRKRLMEMYSETVLELPAGVTGDVPTADNQLLNSIEAVFKSWNTPRAKLYRKETGIPDNMGTAVVIQSMVYGNFNTNSGAGVCFSRNYNNGKDEFVLNFGVNAQGEDVVAGKVAGIPMEDAVKWPAINELFTLVKDLEKKEKDVQDVEFTIQDGKLYILQKRPAKRTAQAKVRIAVDMCNEKLITRQEALARVSRRDYDLYKIPTIDPKSKKKPLATGIPACVGVATGVVVKSAQAAIDCQVPCILVTNETNPDDLAGMLAAKGVLTMQGGETSHAAVVASSFNKPCVVGLGSSVDNFPDGETITIDGGTGRVWMGTVPVLAGGDDAALDSFRDMLCAEAKADLIGQHYLVEKAEDKMLLTPEQRVEKMMAKLATMEGTVYVDCRTEMDEAENNFYNGLTSLNAATTEIEFSTALRKALEAAALPNVTVKLVADCTGADVKVVRSVEGLIMAEGDVVLKVTNPVKTTAKIETLVNKLLELKKDSITPLHVGAVGSGKSFLSESDLVVRLLK